MRALWKDLVLAESPDTVVVHARVTTEVLARMIYAYPTFHRGIEDALRALA